MKDLRRVYLILTRNEVTYDDTVYFIYVIATVTLVLGRLRMWFQGNEQQTFFG
jgi:hypothetical protein